MGKKERNHKVVQSRLVLTTLNTVSFFTDFHSWFYWVSLGFLGTNPFVPLYFFAFPIEFLQIFRLPVCFISFLVCHLVLCYSLELKNFAFEKFWVKTRSFLYFFWLYVTATPLKTQSLTWLCKTLKNDASFQYRSPWFY